MSTSKRLRAPLIVMFGMFIAMMAFTGPANAATGDTYPLQVAGVSLTASVPAAGTSASVPVKVAGTSASVPVKVAGVSASAGTSGLAFTGANAIGLGALGGLLLVGGGLMLFAGRRRKVNA
ncbi:MAG: hypothetical protein IMZ75_00970 [Actinobacteria bacterium]|nr:hypothetical protein [Actinomycetota bacterium]